MRRSRLLGPSQLVPANSLRSPRRTLPSQYQRTIFTTGDSGGVTSLAGYWPLSDTTTDPDLSGNGRDLTWSLTAQKCSQMLSGIAGGVSLAGASLSRYPAASNTSAFTNVVNVEAWVQTTSTADMAIVSARNVGNQFAVYHNNTNKLRLSVGYSAGVLVATINTNVAINDGALHHVVFTWASTGYHLYVDGVQAATGALGVTPSYTANDYLTVGSEGGPGRQWDGYLGHVALYNTTELSADRVAAHYAAGIASLR